MRLPLIVLVLSLVGLGVEGRRKDAYKQQMLKSNRISKHQITEESSTCDDCKMVVEKLKAVIDDPSKLTELKYMLNILCDSMPDSYKQECKNVVAELDTIAEEIKPLLANPETFCREIHLCGSGRRTHAIRVALLFVKKYVYKAADPLRANDVLCDECEFAVNELKSLLADKSLEGEVSAEIKQYVCNNLGSIKDECDSLVDQYVPLLFQELEQLLNNPQGLCKQLGLCGTQRMAIQGFRLTPPRSYESSPNNRLERFMSMLNRLHTREGMNVGCVFCKLGLSTLINAIKDDQQAITGIENGLKKLCGLMPALMIRPGCEDFLSMYARPVITLTLQELSAQNICKDIHVCSSFELRRLAAKGREGAWRQEVVCDACKTAAGFLRYECRQLDFQTAVTNQLKRVCDVAGELSQQCDNLVGQYVPYLIQMVGQELDPDTFCPAIKLCGRTAEEPEDDESLQDVEEDTY